MIIRFTSSGQRLLLVLDHRLGPASRNAICSTILCISTNRAPRPACRRAPEVIGVNVLADDQCGPVDVLPTT